MVMAVGDVHSFSTIAESADDRALLENIDHLFAGLRKIPGRHRGTRSFAPAVTTSSPGLNLR